MSQEGCPIEEKSQETYDTRYTAAGMQSTIYAVQSRNGVQDTLVGAPDSEYTASTGSNWLIDFWNRPTIGWSLQCESEGHTRSEAMQAVSQAHVVSEIDNKFYYRLGVFLVCMNSLWFVLGFLVWFLTRNKERGDRFRIMTLFMYYPLRLSFFVWGPWLSVQAIPSKGDADDNLYTVKVLQKFSDCTDAFQAFDTSAINSNLDTQQRLLLGILILFWIEVCLTLIELVFWLIYCARNKMDNVAKEAFADQLTHGGGISVKNNEIVIKQGKGKDNKKDQQP